ELSAIDRIQNIYRAHGFRAASGEGGKPYGLERYTKAFHAAWRFQHRQALGESKTTLEGFAAREGLSARFVQHIWSVVHKPSPVYPISEVVALWQSLPVPAGPSRERTAAAARAKCDEIRKFLIDWPRWLFAAGAAAEGGQGDERALVLTDASVQAATSNRLRYFARIRGQKNAKLQINIESANPASSSNPLVLWSNATVRFRKADRSGGPPQPLLALLDRETVRKLAFGTHPGGVPIKPEDFVTTGVATIALEVALPDGAAGIDLQVQAAIDPAQAGDAVLRCTITGHGENSEGRPAWALLGNSSNPGYVRWKAGVLEYGQLLPQTSHGEPTPSDKDPIPPPYNNTYNQPERDSYHTQLKYYRTDDFLVEKMLDDATRVRLDGAWSDLLASFEFHDIYLRFVARKYQLDLKNKGIEDLDEADIQAIPAEPRAFVQALQKEYVSVRSAQLNAQPSHVEDCLQFAAKAWRRPLSDSEKDHLRSFYTNSREQAKLGHDKSIRLLLARILVAPAFLYRLERPEKAAAAQPLSGWELASRLSYFLWSSIPDEELRRAAAAGELNQTRQLQRQVNRMLADPKARRLSTEFFGQWLGFYRFDQYRGVDTARFPEFRDEIKTAMYDEAVSFFEHLIRKDRPVREILFADYTFLNQALARHYGVKKEIASVSQPELVEGAGTFQRGGLLRLGAVLTATSAPLRTSPVKRGDWVLRRLLGTPTPPPPADAGSLPADDKAFGGQSVRERLSSHQRNATCAACHSKIDPLGFPFERYDPIGRWREQYSDGKPIEDSGALAGHRQIQGVDGLLGYLKDQEPQVLRMLAQKMLGYSLGRTVLGSDQLLIDKMVRAGGEATFSQLVQEIVASRQFRYRREREDSLPVALTPSTSQAKEMAQHASQRH
ncbi:MAG: DUF1592 domain-containing protein, partial [Acidobacteriia bacterium]|nr:DUF1592 domain-containing protein [Terriglobia bacterium]